MKNREGKPATRRETPRTPQDQSQTVDSATRKRAVKKAGDSTEPRNWLSDEWRAWKVRQLQQAWESGDSDARRAAWDEYTGLLDGLTADENFFHVLFASRLLPELIHARQEIATWNGQPRSEQVKPQAFTADKTGKGQELATAEDVRILAHQISVVLNNPYTPDLLFNDLMEGLNSLNLTKGFHRSSRYLRAILSGYFALPEGGL